MPRAPFLRFFPNISSINVPHFTSTIIGAQDARESARVARATARSPVARRQGVAHPEAGGPQAQVDRQPDHWAGHDGRDVPAARVGHGDRCALALDPGDDHPVLGRWRLLQDVLGGGPAVSSALIAFGLLIVTFLSGSITEPPP